MTVVFNADAHKVTVDAATESDKQVSGKGKVGDTVTITDESGKTLGTGKVGTDGKFSIKTRELVANEKLTVTPSLDGKVG